MMTHLKFILVFTFLFGFNTSFATQFGYSGSDGRDGYDGRSGSDGSNVTIWAKNGPQTFYLQGSDGSYGGDGSYGDDASSCYQSLAHSNMYGADGGDGGRGGDGGHGGDGGDITVYFNQLSQLRGIFVDSTPGEGSHGGTGSYGGEPCRCSTRSWSHQYSETRYRDETYQDCSTRRICRNRGTQDEPDMVCENERTCETRTRRVPYTYTWTEHYTCRDGHHGSRGRNGYHGRRGSYGSITLIQKDSVLQPVRTRRSIYLKNLENTFLLSHNEWSQHSGAHSLFAPSSRISGNYTLWEGRIERKIKFVWDVDGKVPSDFGDRTIGLSIANRYISASFPRDFWHTKTSSTSGDTRTVTITQAVLKDDVTKMQAVAIKGTGKDAYIEIKDNANVSDFVKTRFHIKARWRKASDRKLYNQWVPSEFVTRDGDTFKIHIGKFDLKAWRFLFFPRKKYFKKKKKVKLELTMERSFAGNSTTLPTLKLKQRKLGTGKYPLQVKVKK